MVTSRQRWVTAVGLCIVALWLIGCAPSSGRAALSDLSGSLQSQAAEGALLAHDAASGRSTSIFRFQQARDLYKRASQTEASLETVDLEPTLDLELGELQALASRVTGDLRRLSGDAADLHGISDDLQAAADETQRIDEGLT